MIFGLFILLAVWILLFGGIPSILYLALKRISNFNVRLISAPLLAMVLAIFYSTMEYAFREFHLYRSFGYVLPGVYMTTYTYLELVILVIIALACVTTMPLLEKEIAIKNKWVLIFITSPIIILLGIIIGWGMVLSNSGSLLFLTPIPGLEYLMSMINVLLIYGIFVVASTCVYLVLIPFTHLFKKIGTYKW